MSHRNFESVLASSLLVNMCVNDVFMLPLIVLLVQWCLTFPLFLWKKKKRSPFLWTIGELSARFIFDKRVSYLTFVSPDL